MLEKLVSAWEHKVEFIRTSLSLNARDLIAVQMADRPCGDNINTVIIFIWVFQHNLRTLTQRLKQKVYLTRVQKTHTSKSLFSLSNAIRCDTNEM